jgi:hypothetical protein
MFIKIIFMKNDEKIITIIAIIKKHPFFVNITVIAIAVKTIAVKLLNMINQ